MTTQEALLQSCAEDSRCVAFCRACSEFHFSGTREPDELRFGIHPALGSVLRRHWGAILKLSASADNQHTTAGTDAPADEKEE